MTDSTSTVTNAFFFHLQKQKGKYKRKIKLDRIQIPNCKVSQGDNVPLQEAGRMPSTSEMHYKGRVKKKKREK